MFEGLLKIVNVYILLHRSAYSASKHALQAFMDCLRAEVSKDGINVTVINPGYIKTNLSMNAITGSGNKYGGNDYMFLLINKFCLVYGYLHYQSVI